jgi:hypothetical protein
MSVLVALVLLAVVAGGVACTARLVRVDHPDARPLAEKTAFPLPPSAHYWPEQRIRGVFAQPDEELVLVAVGWPTHPGQVSVLVLQLPTAEQQRQLARWCARETPITTRRAGVVVEFRRRHSMERVHALLVDESPG